MTRHSLKLPHLLLKSGQLFILEKPARVSTVLGSCIGVTFFNPRTGLAAICHALLPRCLKSRYQNSIHDLLDDDCQHCPEAFTYVDCSVSMMVDAFSRFGISPAETQVNLFGGAQIIGSLSGEVLQSVGQQNVFSAKKVLSDHHLKLTLKDVGGTSGRRLFFNTRDGSVEIQKLPRKSLDANLAAMALNGSKQEMPSLRKRI